MTTIEKSKEDARNLNELTDHLIKLIESDDKRFSFEASLILEKKTR